jgi:hypothetical protein
LFAGAWSLISTQAPTDAEATAFTQGFDLGHYQDNGITHGGLAVLQKITTARIRTQAGCDLSGAELMYASVGRANLDISAVDARSELQRHGLRVDQWEGEWALLVACGHGDIQKLAAGSSFEGDPWTQLERLEGAWKSKEGHREKQRFAGCSLRYVGVPMRHVLGQGWEEELGGSGVDADGVVHMTARDRGAPKH